jgi:hypothetical protein
MPTFEAVRSQLPDFVRQYHQVKSVSKAFDPDKYLVHNARRVFDAEKIVNFVDAGMDFYLAKEMVSLRV